MTVFNKTDQPRKSFLLDMKKKKPGNGVSGQRTSEFTCAFAFVKQEEQNWTGISFFGLSLMH